MKKSAFFVLPVTILCCALNAGAHQAKTEDILKNLVLVEKIEPAPEKIKAGLESITAKDSLTLLSFLSSDLMEGRETTTRGYRIASEYAASLLSLWKLKPGGNGPGSVPLSLWRMSGDAPPPAPLEKSYFQEFAMKEITDISSRIGVEVRKESTVKSRTFQSGIDFSGLSSIPETLTAPVVFAGYGITEKPIGYDDFKNLDVKGKIVLILTEAPGENDPKSPFQKEELRKKYFPPAGPSPFRRAGGFNKTAEITKLGAAAVFQVQASTPDIEFIKNLATPRRVSDDRPIVPKPRKRLLIPGPGPRMHWESSPVITISREIADAILENSGQKIDDLQKKIESSYKPGSLVLPGTTVTLTTEAKTSLVRCRNVIAYIEGSDPVLKEEVVAIGAHLDHLGKWEDYIFNGADDNGSGSAGVLNLARAFMVNPEKPKRTVLFCLWTGEEEGLLGSRYYTLNPAFPIEKTLAYFNLDMISRPYDEKSFNRMALMFNLTSRQEMLKKIKLADFLSVSFSAGTGLGDVIREADRYVGLELLLRESDSNHGGGGGSDHSSFAAAKVPWAFFIAALTDDYHQTSDSVEKVSGDLIEKISRLVYISAFRIADQ